MIFFEQSTYMYSARSGCEVKIKLFNKYFLSASSVPDMELGLEDTKVNKTQTLASWSFLVRLEVHTQNLQSPWTGIQGGLLIHFLEHPHDQLGMGFQWSLESPTQSFFCTRNLKGNEVQLNMSVGHIN